MSQGGSHPPAEVQDFAVLDDEQRAGLLDWLATRAADGAADSLDTLLKLIVDHRLARPAIRRLVVNDADVEDVNQDVLIRVSQRIDSYRGDARFTTWLFTIARNTAVDFLRRQREHDELDPNHRLSNAEKLSSLIATRSDLRDAVGALPEHYRIPVQLRDMQGNSYEQIAEQLGIELNTVRSRIARGRALVAGALQPFDSLP